MRISKDSRFTFCFHWADLLGEGKKVDRRKTAEVECGGQGVDGRWTSVKEARSSGDQREKPRAALPAPREPRKVCMPTRPDRHVRQPAEGGSKGMRLCGAHSGRPHTA